MKINATIAYRYERIVCFILLRKLKITTAPTTNNIEVKENKFSLKTNERNGLDFIVLLVINGRIHEEIQWKLACRGMIDKTESMANH